MNARFPVVLAVRRTYETLLEGGSHFAEIAVPRGALLAGAILALSVLGEPFARTTEWAVRATVVGLAKGVCLAVAAGAIGVAWHRSLLATQPLKAPPGTLARYTGRMFAFMFLFGLPRSLLATLYTSTFGPPGAWLAYACSLFVFGLIAARISIALPATGVGQQIDFQRSWALTHRNGLRVFVAAALAIAPVYLLGTFGVGLLWRLVPISGFASHVAHAIMVAGNWTLSTWCGATFTSLAYRFFVDGRADLTVGNIDALREEFG